MREAVSASFLCFISHRPECASYPCAEGRFSIFFQLWKYMEAFLSFYRAGVFSQNWKDLTALEIIYSRSNSLQPAAAGNFPQEKFYNFSKSALSNFFHGRISHFYLILTFGRILQFY